MNEEKQLPKLLRALYKGFTVDGEVVEGSLVCDVQGHAAIIPYYPDKTYDFRGESIDRERACQSTGWLDYEDSIIYAGDVVEHMDGDQFAVAWDAPHNNWGVFDIEDLENLSLFYNLFIASDEVTPVLSNIAKNKLPKLPASFTLSPTPKYRGRTPEGELVYGSAIILSPECVQIRPFNNLITPGAAHSEGILIKPESLSQYVGLEDANGREVYEGDMIESSLGERFIVSWSYEDGWVAYDVVDNKEWTLRFLFVNYYGKRPTVVGVEY